MVCGKGNGRGSLCLIESSLRGSLPCLLQQVKSPCCPVGHKGVPISIATMVHRHNLKEFDALAKWIEELDVIEWNIDVPCVAGRLLENPDLLVTPEQGAPFLN